MVEARHFVRVVASDLLGKKKYNNDNIDRSLLIIIEFFFMR